MKFMFMVFSKEDVSAFKTWKKSTIFGARSSTVYNNILF